MSLRSEQKRLIDVLLIDNSNCLNRKTVSKT